MNKHVCPWWLAYFFDNPLRRHFHKPETLFAPYLCEGMTVTDIGCGMGYFSIAMAKMVGESGTVIAVDIQQKMLDTLIQRAKKAGVDGRIRTVLCDEQSIGIQQSVDFALTFWMVHEIPDAYHFLKQVHAILKPPGKLLLTEPKMHVPLDEFKQTVAIAQDLGFQLIAAPAIYFSHTAVFEKQ